ncbi:30S ribosomal protein S4 [Aquipuribacter sp. MA13-6]|uniref:30S ribosomal protein S4 n=1 Tax=unclassified Aquipuribacter TaxID=2635084 RepID=UPI003EEF487B
MRTNGPKIKLSRALGLALTPKSLPYLERRPYPPGEHGRNRRKESDYRLRLMEKQRLRAQYAVSEAQLRRVFAKASRSGAKTGEVLVEELERRLDAVVLRSGMARTIHQARQFVGHGHIQVNGRRVDRPSYRVSVHDVVRVDPRRRHLPPFVVAAAGAHALERVPSHLDVVLPALTVGIQDDPRRADLPVVCDEQLVVEFYSR